MVKVQVHWSSKDFKLLKLPNIASDVAFGKLLHGVTLASKLKPYWKKSVPFRLEKVKLLLPVNKDSSSLGRLKQQAGFDVLHFKNVQLELTLHFLSFLTFRVQINFLLH
ncbi:hypothetical protein ACMD2_15114 [Ananas comosus]|uniref:Uncharacterized protein n=1 Tax=Ananas comosus TaxID=4615 RepID=A0A199UK91_ANACO|nr:hypothetical protein ACMD2_15114 [Ananas comosus]